MTNREAVNRIIDHMAVHKMREPRAINISTALKMAIEALEKQIPKKPLNVMESIEDLRFDWTCPTCKRQFVNALYSVNHCVDCGQKLDWGENKNDK